jgi:hypothetical protein
MKNKIELYSCGTIVKIKLTDIQGMITCASIRFDRVQYEVSYFYSGEQKTLWLNENEFDTETNKQKIGFK